MVLAMRLQRFGCRHTPFYRIVVADRKSPRDGKFIERLGTYNPLPRNDATKAGLTPPFPHRHALKLKSPSKELFSKPQWLKNQ
eukprot:gene4185-6531_t